MAEPDQEEAQRAAIEVDRSKGDFKYEENYAFDAGVGLTPATIDYIAKVKGEEEWIREFRQKALKIFESLPMPTHWATTDLDNIKFDDIRYYLYQGPEAGAHLGRGPRRREADLRAAGHPRVRAEVPRRRRGAVRLRGGLLPA